jgi:ATF/CREB family transcription factor
MFPAQSPNAAAFIAQLASGGATPSTIDFHRTAMSAAAKRELNAAQTQQPQQQQQQQPQQPQPPQAQQPATSQPQELPNGTAQVKPESKTFDPHDNDAANGLFMLAQGRNGTQSTAQFAPTSAAPVQTHPAPTGPVDIGATTQAPHMSAPSVDSGRGGSVISHMSDESAEQPKPNARGKGKKNNSSLAGRRKADDPAPGKAPPNKKAKGSSASLNGAMSPEPSEEDDGMKDEGGSRSKMTDEEKRKNFLERNRYVLLDFLDLNRTDKLFSVWRLLNVGRGRSNGWPTSKARLSCSALRTNISLLKSRHCGRKLST